MRHISENQDLCSGRTGKLDFKVTVKTTLVVIMVLVIIKGTLERR